MLMQSFLFSMGFVFCFSSSFYFFYKLVNLGTLIFFLIYKKTIKFYLFFEMNL